VTDRRSIQNHANLRDYWQNLNLQVSRTGRAKFKGISAHSVRRRISRILWDLFSDRYWGIVVHGAFLKIDRAQVYQTGRPTAAGGYAMPPYGRHLPHLLGMTVVNLSA